MFNFLFKKYQNSEVLKSIKEGGEQGSNIHHDSYLRVDIEETSQEYVITADLPGYTQNDVEIKVSGQTMTIIATPHGTEHSACFLRNERYHGVRQRSFTIRNVELTKLAYYVVDGVLKVTIPKKT